MAKKIVRSYYVTFVDVEVDDSEYDDEYQMMEDVRLNMSDQITPEQVYEHLSLECTEQEVYDIEDME